MTIDEKKTKSINSALFYNIILTEFSQIFNSKDNYNLPASIIDSFNLELYFTDSSDYIGLPVETFKYHKPSNNPNFQKELTEYIYTYSETQVYYNETNCKPTISIGIKANINDDSDQFNLLENYLNDVIVSDPFVIFYLTHVLEFLNEKNIRLIDETLFKNINEYCKSSFYKHSNFKNHDSVIDLFRINLNLTNFIEFDANAPKNEIETVEYQDLIDNKVLFNTSDMSFDEQIKYAKIINQIDSIEDGVYLTDLLSFNINNTVFLGHCCSFIFKFYYDYEHDIAPMSDGIYFFINKCLNVGSISDFNNRFPNLSQEDLSLINNCSFEFEKQFFSAAMPYIR